METLRAVLLKRGLDVANHNNQELIDEGYKLIGVSRRCPVRLTAPAAHGRASYILAEIGDTVEKTDIRSRAPIGVRRSFYSTYEWRRIRYDVLRKNDGRCELCGQ